MVRKHFETHSQGKINNGQLIKSGLHYVVRYMNATDLHHSMELQDHVMNALKKLGKSHYIIPKTKNYLRKLLANGHAVIGTFVKGNTPSEPDRLAAHMLIVYPQTMKEAGIGDSSVLPDKDLDKIAIAANVLVHQDFRGNKLMQQMMAEWLKIAKEDGKSHAIAEVCVDNEFSWSVFLDCGFAIYASGHDPRDGSDLVYVHKPLDYEFLYSARPEDTIKIRLFDDYGHMNKQAHRRLNNLLEKGFHVLDFDRTTKHILMTRCIGTKPLKTLEQSPPDPVNDNKPR